MCGVFAEFERSMIVERVRSGIAKAHATRTRSGKPIGRPAVPPEKIAAIRSALAAGDNETVHKIAREMRAAA
jgi:DNA invertase Pin-like site-specific DNA recombinase